MGAYIVRRAILFVPVIFLVLLINFIFVNYVPGGPVEQAIAELRGRGDRGLERMGGSGKGEVNQSQSGKSKFDNSGKYQGAKGLDPKIIEKLEKQYGLDRPVSERFWLMINNYLRFNFGESFHTNKTVIALIIEKLPVSISLGLPSTLLIYFISIPLGVLKAVRDGSKFDNMTNFLVISGYAIPGFLFAILLIVLFSGGSYWDIFPLSGLVSENSHELSAWGKIVDYVWHMTLPVLAMVISGFATLTFLTKNFFLEEINKQYVVTARAKGLSEKRVLFGHVFRNAMLIVIAGIPSALIGILFTGSMLVEYIFSLDGLGLLGYTATMTRDYPIMFANIYIFSLMGLSFKLISDITYRIVDPRIDFGSREV